MFFMRRNPSKRKLSQCFLNKGGVAWVFLVIGPMRRPHSTETDATPVSEKGKRNENKKNTETIEEDRGDVASEGSVEEIHAACEGEGEEGGDHDDGSQAGLDADGEDGEEEQNLEEDPAQDDRDEPPEPDDKEGGSEDREKETRQEANHSKDMEEPPPVEEKDDAEKDAKTGSEKKTNVEEDSLFVAEEAADLDKLTEPAETTAQKLNRDRVHQDWFQGWGMIPIQWLCHLYFCLISKLWVNY